MTRFVIFATSIAADDMSDAKNGRSAEEQGRKLAGAVGAKSSRSIDRGANERGRQLAQEIPGKTFDGSTGEAHPDAGSETRRARIARGAYAKAEQRGFQPGGEVDDWLAAEREYDEQEGRGVVG